MPRRFMPERAVRTLLRWPMGLALVSWRYLWSITPLHRGEQPGDATDLPPSLPPGCLDDGIQRVEDGIGALWHRVFEVRVAEAALGPTELISALAEDLNRAAPSEVAVFAKLAGPDGDLAVHDEYVVRMPAPWDGPVRAVHRTPRSFRLATLRGHLESGQVEFRAERAGHALHFTIETWHRCATRLVELLYTRARLAKEIQLNMWVRYCGAAAKLAGGRPDGGITIRTRWLDGAASGQRDTTRERTGS